MADRLIAASTCPYYTIAKVDFAIPYDFQRRVGHGAGPTAGMELPGGWRVLQCDGSFGIMVRVICRSFRGQVCGKSLLTILRSMSGANGAPTNNRFSSLLRARSVLAHGRSTVIVIQPYRRRNVMCRKPICLCLFLLLWCATADTVAARPVEVFRKMVKKKRDCALPIGLCLPDNIR
jgi:hypothetical protein